MIQIESIVAHLQHELQQISDQVLRQQLETRQLLSRLGQFEQRILELEGDGDNLPHERPPHY